MQNTKKLTRVLRELLTLVEEEAARNPAFSKRLDEITVGLPGPKKKHPKQKSDPVSASLPDVFSAYQGKGEEEFRFWLRSFELPILKAIIKVNGFDSGKKSRRWTEPDRFIGLIAEQTYARLRRGSGFLVAKTAGETNDES